MRRTLLSFLCLVFLAAVPCRTVAAQKKVIPFFGAGLAMGTGDLGDGTDTGWLAFAGFDCPIGSTPGLSLGAVLSYTHIPYSGDFGDATNVPALFGELGYTFGSASPSKVKPYVRGGAGVLQHKYDSGTSGYGGDSETKFGFSGGAGLNFLMKSTSLAVGAHIINASDTQFWTLYAGLGFAGTGK